MIEFVRELIETLPHRPHSCLHCLWGTFRSWRNVSNTTVSSLKNLGKIKELEHYTTLYGQTPYSNSAEYWSEHNLHALAYFPYNLADILKCEHCNAHFFFYIDNSGHISQKRLRYITKDLIYFDVSD